MYKTPAKDAPNVSDAYIQSSTVAKVQAGGDHDGMNWDPTPAATSTPINKVDAKAATSRAPPDTPISTRAHLAGSFLNGPLRNEESSTWSQVQVVVQQRWRELMRSPMELLTYFLPVAFLLGFNVLIYETYPTLTGSEKFDGRLEEYFLPFVTWVYVSKTVLRLVVDKPLKLRLKMTGLYDRSYWIAVFIMDGLFIGMASAIICTAFAALGLFNFQEPLYYLLVLVYFACYYLASLNFSIFISNFTDNAQFATEMATLTLIGFFGLFYGMDISHKETYQQYWACLFPQIALQLGARSFVDGYSGITIGQSTSDVPGTSDFGIIPILIVDIFLYAGAAWYCNQVIPSKYTIHKKPWFLFLPSYWIPSVYSPDNALNDHEIDSVYVKARVEEQLDEGKWGRATVIASSLSFHTANKSAEDLVEGVDMTLYEGQIMAILGRNGCGKTVTLDMLVGKKIPTGGSGRIYHNSLLTQMAHAQGLLGVCPQEPLFFSQLTALEHIAYFSQIKTSKEKADEDAYINLLACMGLEGRNNHRPGELSESERRKLAIALAFCGNSKFIVLDDPFFGMDTTSKRQLWKMFVELKEGRTILFTSQNVDDIEAVADRVAIMDNGKIVCSGSPKFLRLSYGCGFKFECEIDKKKGYLNTGTDIEDWVKQRLPGTKFENMVDNGLSNHLIFILPLIEHREKLLGFLAEFEARFVVAQASHVLNFDLRRASMADVFSIAVPHIVEKSRDTASVANAEAYLVDPHGQDFNHNRHPWLAAVIQMFHRKFLYSLRDEVTLCSIIFQYAVFLLAAGFAYNRTEVDGTYKSGSLQDSCIIAGIYVMAFTMLPGNLANFLVKDRAGGTKNLIMLAGCPISAYWIGTFCADVVFQCIPLLGLFVTWFFSSIQTLWFEKEYMDLSDSMYYVTFAVFTGHLVAFAYITSFMFTKASSASNYVPQLLFLCFSVSGFFLLLAATITHNYDNVFSGDITSRSAGGVMLCIVTFLTPHGAMFTALLNLTAKDDLDARLRFYPELIHCLYVMAGETFLYLLWARYIDASLLIGSRSTKEGIHADAVTSVGRNVEDGVRRESERVDAYVRKLTEINKAKAAGTASIKPYLRTEDIVEREEQVAQHFPGMVKASDIENQRQPQLSGSTFTASQDAVLNTDPNCVSICVDRLNIQYPAQRRLLRSKNSNEFGAVNAIKTASFAVNKGEIYGVLGTNGSGKSTLISSQLSHLLDYNLDVRGDFLVEGFSVYDDLGNVIKQRVGYVGENCCLWDWMTVEEHLYLFARMGGLFTEESGALPRAVAGIMMDFELDSVKSTRAKILSSGMRRKLELAIAIIINPHVLLMESISDYMDAWSKTRVYNILQKSFQNRTAIIATADGTDAETLCSRIGIMYDGKIVACGSKNQLKDNFAWGYILTISVSGEQRNLQIEKLSKLIHNAYASSTILSADHIQGHVSFAVKRHEMSIGSLYVSLARMHNEIWLDSISVLHPSLDQVVFERVEGNVMGRRLYAKFLEEAHNHYMDIINEDDGDLITGIVSYIATEADWQHGYQDMVENLHRCRDAIKLALCPCYDESWWTQDQIAASLLGDTGQKILETNAAKNRKSLTIEEIYRICPEKDVLDMTEFLIRLIQHRIIPIDKLDKINRKRDIDPWLQIFMGISRGGQDINRKELLAWAEEERRLDEYYGANTHEEHCYTHCYCGNCRDVGVKCDACIDKMCISDTCGVATVSRYCEDQARKCACPYSCEDFTDCQKFQDKTASLMWTTQDCVDAFNTGVNNCNNAINETYEGAMDGVVQAKDDTCAYIESWSHCADDCTADNCMSQVTSGSTYAGEKCVEMGGFVKAQGTNALVKCGVLERGDEDYVDLTSVQYPPSPPPTSVATYGGGGIADTRFEERKRRYLED